MKLRLALLSLLTALLLSQTGAAYAAEALKPFVLAANRQYTDLDSAAAAVKPALQAQGFVIAGSYAPYPNAVVIAVTSEALKASAAKSDFGGYGAVQRVALTKTADEIQVSYTNPPYWAAAYRLRDSLTDTKAKLEAALGKQEEFGSKNGISETDLRKYHYAFGMEKFDSLGKHLLGEFETRQAALDAVESGLASGKSGVTKVYRIDVPGKDETVFGVGIGKGKGADKYIMDYIDFAQTKSTAHLPYEILVSGNKVYHLYARFRIAISFPDLSMMGANSFMSIMSSPEAIKGSLMEAIGLAKNK